ncbi:MAG: TatD family hydrolase [Clostridiales bacterium]|nr:TatD family hydrolase [Clostridiales bacterium]
MLFDSHMHLNNEDLTDSQRAELAREIGASDVSYAVDIGFNLESSALAAGHAEKYPWCYAAAGYHPHDAKEMDDMGFQMIRALAKKPKVVAIGEIGLDFHYDHSPRDVQRECFRKQIRLANELKMPIVIHAREADEEVLRILREEQAFSNERTNWFPKIQGAPDARVLLHCFSGSAELARQYVRLGGTISVAGPITYKNARKGVEVVMEVPIDRLLVETDAPYLAPEPMRGKRNKTPYVEYTARKVAEIKGLAYEEAAKATCENAKRFYGIS